MNNLLTEKNLHTPLLFKNTYNYTITTQKRLDGDTSVLTTLRKKPNTFSPLLADKIKSFNQTRHGTTNLHYLKMLNQRS